MGCCARLIAGLHIHIWIQQQYESSIGDNSQIRSIVFRKRNEEVAFALHKWRSAWNATLLHYPSSKPALYQKSALAFWYAPHEPHFPFPLPPPPYSHFQPSGANMLQVPREILQRSKRLPRRLRRKPTNSPSGTTSPRNLHDDGQWEIE